MTKKQACELRREIYDGEAVDWFLELLREERQKQGEHVAIASLSVEGKITLCDQMLKQKAPDPRSEESRVTHLPRSNQIDLRVHASRVCAAMTQMVADLLKRKARGERISRAGVTQAMRTTMRA